MRIALGQINPTIGDLEGNAKKILAAAAEGARRGADLVVLPELAITGYPPKDLLDRRSFVEDGLAAVDALVAKLPRDVYVAFGFVDRAPSSASRALHNALALAHGGEIVARVHKRLLPTYDVFDDDRYFEPGKASAPIEIAGLRVGFTICEDIWNDVDVISLRRYAANPIAELVASGATLIVNAAASPFNLDKRGGRARMLAGVATHHRVPVAFVNQVGGNDDLIFDGHSAIFGADGSMWAEARELAEDLLVAECAPGGPRHSPAPNVEAAALDALVLGTRDYAQKCGFKSVVLGLSGGIDSALVAAIAARALGPENVLGVAMPTRYSSQGSFEDARALADALGITLRVVPIDPIFQAHIDALTPHLEALGPASPGDVTWENVQSRIRCATLMAVSNRAGHLLLTTGNKSEVAVGYCTLYGDMAGGLAVIGDLPKTQVYRVARELNRQEGRAVIPESTLTKAPSAELRPNQTDQDSLPPYEVLDAIIEAHVERGETTQQIIARGFEGATVERVLRLIRNSEYKRQQMPPTLILTRKAFASGRRYPIAQGYKR